MRHQDRRCLSRFRTPALAAIALLLVFAVIVSADPATAEEPIANLRASPIVGEPPAPPMAMVSNTDLKRARNYPEQPPTIPHSIRGYQVDHNANKCLTCHARAAIARSQAPMISVTHFMDRDGQVLATVSPRRYFCNQCHVTQSDVRPLIINTFKDVDGII